MENKSSMVIDYFWGTVVMINFCSYCMYFIITFLISSYHHLYINTMASLACACASAQDIVSMDMQIIVAWVTGVSYKKHDLSVADLGWFPGFHGTPLS